MTDTPRTPQAFAELIAHKAIEGECTTHPYPGDPDHPCESGPDCKSHEPYGNDPDIDTLYQLIATARHRLEQCDAERDTRYRDAARTAYAIEGQLEIDDDAIISGAHNHALNEPCNDADEDGSYVAAWVWIDAESIE